MSTADPGAEDERRLITGALRALAVVGAPLVLGAALLVGTPGVLGALSGLGLAALLIVGGAGLSRAVAGRSPGTVATVLVLGVVGRLLAYAAGLVGLSRLGGVDRATVAVTTAVAVAVVLAYELRLLSAMPRLFWIDAHPDRPRAVSHTTRSQLL